MLPIRAVDTPHPQSCRLAVTRYDLSVDDALAGLVGADGSWVDRKVIADPAIYERELAQIFHRSWVVVAHECQVPEPGCFVTSTVGEDPVIVSRDRSGGLHVLVNSCTHRANQVCRVDEGKAGSWTCPNHGWTFGNDGRLLGIPSIGDGYEDLDRSDLGLMAATGVESYHGLVFATFDCDPDPLEDHLGDAAYYLESVFDRYEHGLDVLDGTMRSLIATNWKLALENLGTDLQHPEVAHAAFMDLWPDPVAEFLDGTEQIVTSSLHPVCLGRRPPPYTEADLVLGGVTDAAERREVADWYERTNRYAEDHLGHERASFYVFTGSVFPNLSFLPGTSAVFVLHPCGPLHTEWWSWCVVPRDAPRAVRAARRQMFMLTVGPGGMILAEDAEVWADMTRMASPGRLGSRLRLRVDRGMGTERRLPGLPGVVAPMRSEHAQRGFWRNWRRWMVAS